MIQIHSTWTDDDRTWMSTDMVARHESLLDCQSQNVRQRALESRGPIFSAYLIHIFGDKHLLLACSWRPYQLDETQRIAQCGRESVNHVTQSDGRPIFCYRFKLRFCVMRVGGAFLGLGHLAERREPAIVTRVAVRQSSDSERVYYTTVSCTDN